MKFGTRVRLKRWNDWVEFEHNPEKGRNNIAENSIALGHETHNTLWWWSIAQVKLKEVWLLA